MRLLRFFCLFVVVFSFAAFAADLPEKGPLTILITPTAEAYRAGADVVLKVSITNNSKEEYNFSTCPEPYTVSLKSSEGKPIAQRPPDVTPDIVDLQACGRTFNVAIRPGETWSDTIDLSGKFDLATPGTYRVRVQWQFPVNLRKVRPNEYDSDTLLVWSNATTFAVTR